MPKAAKGRASTRRDPLKPTNSNASKKASKAQKQVRNEESPANLAAREIQGVAPSDSYLLLVKLCDTFNPTITRLLSVPSHYNFYTFHKVLQVAFGWANSHAYAFEVSRFPAEDEPADFFTGRGKKVLTIQADAELMGDCFRDFGLVVKEAKDTTLSDIYDGDEFRGKVEIAYKYDHGDGWDHHIAFLGRADPVLRKSMSIPDDIEVVCLGGEGHPCAEDCGGEPGWEHLKAVFKKRNDPEGLKDWYKNQCANGDPKGLDPFRWDVLEVNDELQQIKQ